MTAGLNFVTRRPRLEILKEYRGALRRIYSPHRFFSRAFGPPQAFGFASTATVAAGLARGLAAAFMGISIAVILLPSIAGDRSTLPRTSTR